MKKSWSGYEYQIKYTSGQENYQRQKEHYIVIKGSVHQEVITVYKQNNKFKYIKQKFRELKKINKLAYKWGTSLPLLLVITTQKISMGVKELNDILNRWNLTDIYRTLLPSAAKYIFFVRKDRKFTKIDHILDHKTNLTESNTTESTLSMFSDYNEINLEINIKKIY